MRLSLSSLARACARRPWLVAGLWGLGLLAAVAVIVLVLPGTLTAQYTFMNDPDSQVGRDLLAERLEMPQKANEVVIVRSAGAAYGDPAFERFVTALQGDIAALGPGVVDAVASPYQGGDETMVSRDGRTVILPVVMAGDVVQAEENIDTVHDLVHQADGRQGFDTLVTGTASISSDFSHQAENDLRRGEGIGVPIALVILLLVFGALVAATLPLLLGVIAITAAVAVTALVGQVTDISVFSINMISMMGLATGIDYSLFIVSRFREERAKGHDKLDAVAVTGGTASRAVLFSGLTVVLALIGMLIVPTNIFFSLALGAIVVVSLAVLAALTLLPAALGILGDRVNSLRVPYLGRRLLDSRAAGRTGLLARAATRAAGRPAIALTAGVVLLLLAAAPLLGMHTGVSGVASFPDSFESKQAFGVLERQFSVGGVSPVQVVVDGPADSPQVQDAVAGLQQRLAADGSFGPPQVQTARSGDLALVSVPMNLPSTSDEGLAKVRELREQLVPAAFAGSGASVYVTGETAGNIDYIDIVNQYFPYVIGLVLALSFLLLLVAFRSLVVPALSIVMNLLSVGAAYGLVTLVSQQGWGAELLGFRQVEVIEQWVPLFLFSILFGLSMDYQVFLLSRIKEDYDRTGDARASIASGIGSTAGIITGAALIMVAVFAGFAAGDLVMFQQMGFGLAVAVLLDATLVRVLLVPAAMTLLGRWNWYLPRWLAWMPRLSIEGGPAGAPGAGGSLDGTGTMPDAAPAISARHDDRAA
jgi:RND superfamily putative drug exporter